MEARPASAGPSRATTLESSKRWRLGRRDLLQNSMREANCSRKIGRLAWASYGAPSSVFNPRNERPTTALGAGSLIRRRVGAGESLDNQVSAPELEWRRAHLERNLRRKRLACKHKTSTLAGELSRMAKQRLAQVEEAEGKFRAQRAAQENQRRLAWAAMPHKKIARRRVAQGH